ncbi:MAG TPA: prepilin-type N-terminal cleavage/methylation domain-containing protein [Chthoniobacteraceae bacterium]|jgi:prepilin-type N-terminal cleavage/methylation domain-containing protein/prepilin-type processing-associated H-X9-DG protein
MKKAFTLIELLVVISVIAVLAAMLTPVVTTSVAQARASKCLQQLRQIGAAVNLYANDNSGELPASRHQGVLKSWVQVIQPYAGGKILYRCPDDPNPKRDRSYAINDLLTAGAVPGANYTRRQNIPAASQTIYLAETQANYVTSDHFHFGEEGAASPEAFIAQVAAERHRGLANYLFADGHVTALQWSEVMKKLTEPGDCFVNPGATKE